MVFGRLYSGKGTFADSLWEININFTGKISDGYYCSLHAYYIL